MAITIQGVTYKSKRAYYESLHPGHKGATQNDIDRFIYQNVEEYHNKKQAFYREKYRTKKNNNVRRYEKYKDKNITNSDNMSSEQFNNVFFK